MLKRNGKQREAMVPRSRSIPTNTPTLWVSTTKSYPARIPIRFPTLFSTPKA